VGLHSLGVDNMDCFTNLGDKNHGANTTHLPREILRQDNQVVSTDRGEVNDESILIVIGLILLVMTDQLFCMFLLANNVIVNEVRESLCM
jgi:hypothetical protein